MVWSIKTQLGSSATLSITAGQLVLTNGSTGSNLWPFNVTATPPSSAQLVLRDDGNLVFSGNWESFTFPTDTFLPNQTINGTKLTSSNGKCLTFFYSTDWKPFFEIATIPDLLAEKGRKLNDSDHGTENQKHFLYQIQYQRIT